MDIVDKIIKTSGEYLAGQYVHPTDVFELLLHSASLLEHTQKRVKLISQQYMGCGGNLSDREVVTVMNKMLEELHVKLTEKYPHP